MSNTSATGGYLSPLSTPAPIEDDALANFFQALVANVSGLVPSLVRPRWQPESPNIPQLGVSWASVGIIHRQAFTYAAILHDPSGSGADYLDTQEELELMVSMYGADADANMALFRDGMQIAQNREVLQLANMGWMSCGEVVTAPSLVKEKWLYRVDMKFKVLRQIIREYAVESLLSATIQLITDIPSHTNVVTNNAGVTPYGSSALAQAQINTDLIALLTANPGGSVLGNTFVFPNQGGAITYSIRFNSSYYIDYTEYRQTWSDETVINIPVVN